MEASITLKWASKDLSGQWLKLADVNVLLISASGVYMIWCGGADDHPSRIVYVGQGDVAELFLAHRKDPAIQAYKNRGLYVTWAEVPAAQRDGVERYLVEACKPLVGDVVPDAAPIVVNAPWP